MQVQWLKCQGDVWCKLNSVNLAHQHFENLAGVYIIWHAGTNPATVYVGQGNIRQHLTALRADRVILQYDGLGVYVTWAIVADAYRIGVVRYLADVLRPKNQGQPPEAQAIQVNLPW